MNSTNAATYRFADFTHDAYRALVRLARAKYDFRGYDAGRLRAGEIAWRHDLDFGVADALPLAAIEAEEGVRATYFVHLRSDFYNVLHDATREHLRAIKAMGHAFGLHFDFRVPGGEAGEPMEARLAREARLLEGELRVAPVAFSFHNPGPEALAYAGDTCAGLVNTYSRHFREEVDYCSDSNGYWRHARLADVLSAPDGKPLQVLTHPTWWTREVMSPRKKIERAALSLATDVLDRYRAALAGAGRPDIDW